MFLFELYSNSITTYLLKLLLTPLIAFFAMLIIKAIVVNFYGKDLPFIFRAKLSSLISLILTLFIVNAIWFYVIKTNGFFSISWNKFDMKLTNTYVALFPLFLTYIGVISIYFITESKLKKSI
jgi:hypothetical protein